MEERFFDRINIKVKGYDHPVLDSYVKFVSRAANNLDIEIHGTAALPTRVKKFTVLKSPHIYKKHRVQFETRTHARLLQVGLAVVFLARFLVGVLVLQCAYIRWYIAVSLTWPDRIPPFLHSKWRNSVWPRQTILL